ncbi:MAG: metallophosphoesterase family protein [Candidatus Omnitrophica bacterium]|nr:metallophosphoesterase family protein [Candidatus Omnitrophota bacterium]
MIIGVLSDTHSFEIPEPVIQRFKKVDLILHAGDFCDMHTLRLLQKLAPVKGVQGNMDAWDIKHELPLKDVITCGDLRIGLTHGHIGGGRDALKNAASIFENEKMDVVVFGHLHRTVNERIKGALYFNPGTPNDPGHMDDCTYGLMSIEGKKINAEIVKF